jgi:hypothetical protein
MPYNCVAAYVARLLFQCGVRLYETSPGKSTLLLISWPEITTIRFQTP